MILDGGGPEKTIIFGKNLSHKFKSHLYPRYIFASFTFAGMYHPVNQDR